MPWQEILGIAGFFMTIGVGIFSLVNWFYRGKINQDLEAATQEIASLQ